MFEVAPVLDRGQVTLPKEVREDLNLKPKDKVVFIKVDGNYVIKKLDEEALRQFLLIDRPEQGYDAERT